jgi:hypothetical protein
MARTPDKKPTTWLLIRGILLVSPECSKKLAKHWGLPVLWHDRAGHDLPLDDPDWLVAQIARRVN